MASRRLGPLLEVSARAVCGSRSLRQCRKPSVAHTPCVSATARHAPRILSSFRDPSSLWPARWWHKSCLWLYWRRGGEALPLVSLTGCCVQLAALETTGASPCTLLQQPAMRVRSELTHGVCLKLLSCPGRSLDESSSASKELPRWSRLQVRLRMAPPARSSGGPRSLVKAVELCTQPMSGYSSRSLVFVDTLHPLQPWPSPLPGRCGRLALWPRCRFWPHVCKASGVFPVS